MYSFTAKTNRVTYQKPIAVRFVRVMLTIKRSLIRDMSKIAFVWYWDRASSVINNYRDGLRAAIELIAKEHQVDWFLDKERPEDEYDAIIFWDDSNSEFFNYLGDYHGKKGLCLTTDPQNFDNLRKLDVVYCESQPVYEAVRQQGIHAIRAFGTDTDFFKPDDTVKDIEYFYPATFSPWKLQRDIAHLGDKLLCVGTVQPDGVYDLTQCLENGVKVKQGYLPVKKIRQYYQRSKYGIIPAVHGSERTVLEFMACGIKPEVNKDNIKAYSYIKELEASGLSPRDFVVKNYNHKKYAKDILKGLGL